MIEKWKQLELWICDKLSELDPYIGRTPGSGNKGIKGDVRFSTNLGLHIEAKWRNLKSVYNIDWLKKCEEEIPLHSKKIALLVTENNKGKKIAHLDADEFFEIYKEWWRMKRGEKSG